MFERSETLIYFLAAIGIIFSALLLIYLLNILIEGVRLFIIPRFFPPNIKKYGEWAVITGSTDGIGRSYARELARRKMNIALVSIGMDRLRRTVRELEEEFKVNVEITDVDFSNGWDLYQLLKDELKDKDIGVLVNNVGVMAPQPCYFLSLTDKEILNMIHVNITSMLLMTRIVLPEMMKRKRGAIVTMSSLMSMFIMPLISCYGATKSAVNSLGTALSYEKLPNIDFQTLVLSCVTTDLVNYSNPIWKWLTPFAPSSDTFASSAINTIGISKHTTGYLGHSVQLCMKLCPEIVQKYLNYWFILKIFKKQLAVYK